MKDIIVTVGPSSGKRDIIRKLKKAGASSFRINLSHTDKDNLKHYFKILNDEGINPAIDTQGAQLRVRETNIVDQINLDEVIQVGFGINNKNNLDPNNKFIILNHPEVIEQISKGDIMKIDFDGLALEILGNQNKTTFLAKVISSGIFSINKAVDINSKSLNLSVLTSFDKYAIDYALSKGSKEIYASFISEQSQANLIRKIIGPNIDLISKIETSLGVANVTEIIKVSDRILIDRGDLSREITIPSIPLAVFNILKLANEADNAEVLIATNILDSMMNSNLPSRSEISDIFNHLSSGASGIVLAAEVAIGENPVSSTALLNYLMKLFENYKNGFHGIGKVEKPSKELIGEELYNWL